MTIQGTVLHGAGYGRKIGFPTINLDRRQFSRLGRKPALGVYAGWVRLGGRQYRAGVIIGPVDRRGLPRVEAHLIGYSGDAYGRRAEIELGKFIRKFRAFRTEVALKRQIEKDLEKC